MRMQIQRWGHSLAVRIPLALASEAGLQDGTVVDLTLVDGKLIMRLPPEPLSLETMLAAITPENQHAGQDFGGPVGREAL